MMDTQHSQPKPTKSRRQLLQLGAVLTAIPIVKTWTKPVITSVVLPAHAQTSIDDPLPPTPTQSERFALSVDAPNGPTSQGAVFYVDVDAGVFSISIFTDAQNTDLSPGITNASAAGVDVFVDATFSGCSNDGSSGPPIAASQRVQIASYTPGVSVEVQFEFASSTYTLPLNNSATAPVCPIL